MTEFLSQMTSGRNSIQQINTSLDDDSIIDMLKSSNYSAEIEQQQHHPSRKHKLKQLFNHTSKHKTKKHRKPRKRQDTKYNPNTPDIISTSNTVIFKPSKTYKSSKRTKKSKKSRSQSVPRVDPMNNTQTDSAHNNKLHRLQSFFDKLNALNGVMKPIETITRKNSHKTSEDAITPISTTSTTTLNSSICAVYTPSVTNNRVTITRNSMQKHILWRPLLKDIYNDKQLLDSLIAFMERIYCEENILFLQAVQLFKFKIDSYIDSDEKQSQIECNLSDNIKRDIDFQIISIYNEYIVSNAELQVNLSYDCFMNSLGRREAISTISLHKKRTIFDNCVDEIERLIMSSVLSPFYDSAEFAVVAQQRPRSHGLLTYNRDSIKIKKRNPFAKLINSTTSLKQNSKYDIDSNDSNDDNNSDSDTGDLINNYNSNAIFHDDDDDDQTPVPFPSINDASKMVKMLSRSEDNLHNLDKKMNRVNTGSIASVPIKRKDSGYGYNNSYGNSYNYLSQYNSYNNTISPISTTNDTNISSISNGIDNIDSRSPLSLSQSKSEQFDITNSFCSPEPNNNINQKHKLSDSIRLKTMKEIEKYNKKNGTKHTIDSMDEHIKTYSDGQILQKIQLQKLKGGNSNSNKKYFGAKTKSPKHNSKDKKKKKRLKKKKKKQLAMDDGKIKQNRSKNRVKKLKKIKKISLRKRRKSNNDSDILLMLYRDNKEDKENTIKNANQKNNNNNNMV